MDSASDIGEDRALTNMIFKQGQKVLFQNNVIVLTDDQSNIKDCTKCLFVGEEVMFVKIVKWLNMFY